MSQKATIILIENSSAGNPPKTFADQMVDIQQVSDTRHVSVDGIISTAKHPSTIIWYGGTASDFENITDIQIIASDGETLVDSEILRNFEQPCATQNGVQFQVLI